MLSKLRNKKQNYNEEGFTLIEIVVVILIIGILAAISIPIFITQQNEAYIASVKTDLRNAGEFMENRFTAEKGYPTSLEGISVSDGNTLNLIGGGITSSVSGVNTGTEGFGNTGNSKPKVDRLLTADEFKEFNNANTGTPYMTFANKTNSAFGGDKYSSAFIYDAETLNSLTAMEGAFFNICNFVKNQNIEGYVQPTPESNFGSNNCLTYTSNTDEVTKSLTRDKIVVINDFNSRNTPSFTTGTPLSSFNFNSNGYYVIVATKDVANNDVWGGTSTQSDLTIYKVSNNDTLTNSSPNIWCDSDTLTGKITLTGTNSGSRDYCGSPAINSGQTPDSFWSLSEIPEIPAGLLDDEAVAGAFGAYCIEGHNSAFSNSSNWYHISANDGKVKTGRCA